jgi:ATP/maltotriose-dependent transcriptional regulator MalT
MRRRGSITPTTNSNGTGALVVDARALTQGELHALLRRHAQAIVVVADRRSSTAPLAPLAGPALRLLSCREREVACLVAEGLRNGEIARRLSVSEATVKTHLIHVFAKLGLRNRAELVGFAIRAEILPEPAGARLPALGTLP